MQTYLRTSEIAWKIQAGEPVFGEYIFNLLMNTLYYMPGLAFLNLPGHQILLGGLVASSAIQIMANIYITANRDRLSKLPTDRTIAMLPSAQEVENYMLGKTGVSMLVWITLQRSLVILAAFKSIGLSWGKSIAAALISSGVVELSVIDRVRKIMINTKH